MASRKVSDLDPKMQPKAMLFATKMAEAGLPFMFTCTRRSEEEQRQLYWIGRRGLNGERPVTWTLKSKHIVGLAFDIAILKEGKPTWDMKVSVNDNDIPDYLEAAKIGKLCGLRCGIEFGDAVHFELPEGR